MKEEFPEKMTCQLESEGGAQVYQSREKKGKGEIEDPVGGGTDLQKSRGY